MYLPNGSACLGPSAYSTASSASEFSVGYLMSPDGTALWPNLCVDSPATKPAYRPWNRVSEAMSAPTEPALLSTYYWPSSHFSAGTRGSAHYGCCCRASSFISTRCSYSAPSCFDSSLCWIRVCRICSFRPRRGNGTRHPLLTARGG